MERRARLKRPDYGWKEKAVGRRQASKWPELEQGLAEFDGLGVIDRAGGDDAPDERRSARVGLEPEPIRDGLGAPTASASSDDIGVAVAASTVAELANWAIASGRAPRWYDRSLTPTPSGSSCARSRPRA